MDLSENGKCLFTSLQYVESSHAPYQRIRFFIYNTHQASYKSPIWAKTFEKIREQHFFWQFLEDIFKKMGSTEIIVMSSVRLSVRLSVCDLFLGRYRT
jgi:hypothetical protein